MQRDFMSVLIYRLQRKSLESNADNTKDTSTSIQLLVIWEPMTRDVFFVRALLIKHNNTVTWDEDKLRELHAMHLALLRDDDIIKNTCLLDGTTILMATPREIGLSLVTEITISKRSEEDNFMVLLSL
jgi:hypothetical protein